VRDGYSFIERAKKINSEEERRIWWSRVLQELANASGPGIKITKFEVDKKDFRQIKVSGVAATRESMIFLEQRLKVSEFYKEVISPVSNLTSKENVSFEFTLKLKDEWKN
ncbi:PilN domain-containing protein, partial [Patescibacteria group bacterium]|nr:PilN domain-containing protein [Patescibacteria group bacterium]